MRRVVCKTYFCECCLFTPLHRNNNMLAHVLAMPAFATFLAPSAPAHSITRSQPKRCATPRCAAGKIEGSTWKIILNVGREQGTKMPSEWAASGARLSLPLQVTFADEASDDERVLEEDDALDEPIKRLVCSDGSFVSKDGVVKVTRLSGAWSAAPVIGESYGQRLLRFFIDFPHPVQRNDVTIPAGRMYCSTVCWDGGEKAAAREPGFEKMRQVERELDELSEELEAMVEERKSGERGLLKAMGRVSDDLQRAQQAQKLLTELQRYRTVLPAADSCVEGQDGVWVADEGGLVIRRADGGNKVFGGASEFLIGTRIATRHMDIRLDGAPHNNHAPHDKYAR